MLCKVCGHKLAHKEPVCPLCRTPAEWPSRARWLTFRNIQLFAIAFVVLASFGWRLVQPWLPLRTSPVVRAALDRVIGDPRVVAALGQPIHASWSIIGYIKGDETGWTEGRLWIPVHGSKGDGTLYVRAGRGYGPWTFSTLELRPKDGPSINFLDAPAGPLGPPKGPVYLVHLGPPQHVFLEPLAAYYQSHLELTVGVLPPAPLDRSAFDHRRQQFVAEKLVSSLQQQPSLQAITRDQTATIIAVLEDDMYMDDDELDRDFVFNYRPGNRFVVVATRRLVPPQWRFWDRDALIQTRVRKLVTKNIGIVAYGLPLKSDPTSLLYDSIVSTADLDLVQERFDGLGRLAEVSALVVSHHDQPVEAEIVKPAGTVQKPGGWYPCFVVRPGAGWDGRQSIETQLTDCLPGLRTEKGYDEFEINLRAGMLVTRQTDLFVPDIVPLALTRCYRLWDRFSRSFGVGWNHPYDILPTGSRNPYTYVDLIMPDGGSIHYPRISGGTGYADAVYEHTETATPFLHSEFRWNGDGWDLRFPDGSLFLFPENYAGPRPHHGAPTEMRDSRGHTIRFTRDGDRNLERLTSNGGHFIRLEHDAESRVTHAADDSGHEVSYTYDQGGRLVEVKTGDRVVRYGYRDLDLVKIEASKSLLEVSYDEERRATDLTVGDGRTFHFSYVGSGQKNGISEAIVRAPDGSQIRVNVSEGMSR